MQLNYLLQTWHTPTQGIRLYALDIQYVCTEYGLNTKVQQCD